MFFNHVLDSESISQEPKKRKQRANSSGNNQPVSKKKVIQITEKDMDIDDTGKGSLLTDKDKKLLERWENMQKNSKPFVHPIRYHMNDLQKLKGQSTIITSNNNEETVKGQPIVDRVSTNKLYGNLQFTNFIPKSKDGGISLVPEQTQTVTADIKIVSDVSEIPKSNTSTTKAKDTAANVVTSSAKAGMCIKKDITLTKWLMSCQMSHDQMS